MLNSFSRKKEVHIKTMGLCAVVGYIIKKLGQRQLAKTFQLLKSTLSRKTEDQKKRRFDEKSLKRFLTFKGVKSVEKVVDGFRMKKAFSAISVSTKFNKAVNLLVYRVSVKQRNVLALFQSNNKAFLNYISFKKKLALKLRRLQEKNRESMNIYTDENKVVSKLIIRLESILVKNRTLLKETAFEQLFNNLIVKCKTSTPTNRNFSESGFSFPDDSGYNEIKAFLAKFGDSEEIDFLSVETFDLAERLKTLLDGVLSLRDRKRCEHITVKYIEFLEAENFGLLTRIKEKEGK